VISFLSERKEKKSEGYKMANVHTLVELKERDTMASLALSGKASGGSDTSFGNGIDVDMNNAQSSVTENINSDDDVVTPERMRDEIDHLRSDYDNMDKSRFEMDEDTRVWLDEKDEDLVIKSSKSRLNREIGMQMRKIDIKKNDLIGSMRMKVFEHRKLMQKWEREIERVIRDADAQKNVLRRKRIHLKAHPI
jgi:hypothetical protein